MALPPSTVFPFQSASSPSDSEQWRPGYDFASVILDAPAGKVFSTELETARKNTSVRILMHDSGARRLQIAERDRTATLNVVSFNDDVSQLMIARHAGPMNKHCEVGN